MLYDLGPRAGPVYHLLLDRILSGELAPGTRLPSHTRLAQTFGVAPLTMRQVLARLEADSLVMREQGRGTFVRAAESADVLVLTSDPDQQARLAEQVQQAGRRVVLAATTAEGLAALEREPSLILAVVDLHLPAASDGLTFVRSLRRRKPELPVVVLGPSARQTSRLERTVAPPLLILHEPLSGHLADVLRTQVGASPANPHSALAAPAHHLPELLERYVDFLLRGEQAPARAMLLDGLSGGLDIADLYVGVLAPAQHQIGHLWQQNDITVAGEHLATAITSSVMGALSVATPLAPASGVRVLVACVERELHDIAARMVADLLQLDGFAVRFLGANVPTDSLLSMIEEQRPHLLVLSVTMPEHLHQLSDAVVRVRQTEPAQLRIVVGGQILHWLPDLALRFEIDLAAGDALKTLEFGRRMRSGLRPPVQP